MIIFIIGSLYVVISKSLEIATADKNEYFGCFIKANIQVISEKYPYMCRETRLTKRRKNTHNDANIHSVEYILTKNQM